MYYDQSSNFKKKQGYRIVGIKVLYILEKKATYHIPTKLQMLMRIITSSVTAWVTSGCTGVLNTRL
jgi:hypothetical protein